MSLVWVCRVDCCASHCCSGTESAAMAAATAEETSIPEEDDPNADNNELRLTPETELISVSPLFYSTTKPETKRGWWDPKVPPFPPKLLLEQLQNTLLHLFGLL